MPKITVIMPALNAAEYIKPCMDSVCCQTWKDMEILFIDAGSEDGTLEIVQGYAERDSRIRMLHAGKKSYGYQLNMGIAEAAGEYIGVVETDDIIVPDMFQVLYRVAEESGADYVKGAAEAFLEIPVCGESSFPIRIFGQEEYERHQGRITVVPKETPELVLTDTYLWNGLYRRDFIKKIRLNETPGAAYQDIGFMAQAHMSSQKAVYLDKVVYRYRRTNPGSSCYNRNAFQYLVQEYNYVEQFLRKQKDRAWSSACCYKMFRQINIRFQTMAESGEYWENAQEAIAVLVNRLKAAVDNGVLRQEALTDKEREAFALLLEGPEALYHAYKKEMDAKISCVQEMISYVNVQEAVIFGAGKCGKFLYALARDRLPQSVAAFCDSQKALWGTSIEGIPVLPPEEAVKQYPNAVYLLAGKGHGEEMRLRLEGLGIKPEGIFTYTAGIDTALLGLKI